MELSGRLASFPIGELLMWAKNERRSGALVLRRTSREKRIYFADGQVGACHTNQPAEYYGQHLLLSGVITEEVLRDCIQRCRSEGKRLGDVLVEAELLDSAEVERTLRSHVLDIVLDIFLWEHGIFFFEHDPPSAEDVLAEPVDPLELVFEGTQWKEGFAKIRETFPHDQVILARGLDLRGGFTPRHQQIYDQAERGHSLDTIYENVAGSYYRFLQAASDLHLDGFLKIVDIGNAALLGTVELPLRELLLEEAEREQRDSARLYTSPVGPFLRFVPVWVRRPTKEQWDPLPREVKELYLKFDGTRRLEEILAEDDGGWRLHVELLMLQVKQEAVALLPAPVAKLRDHMKQLETEESWWRDLLGEAARGG